MGYIFDCTGQAGYIIGTTPPVNQLYSVSITESVIGYSNPQSTHRVAIADISGVHPIMMEKSAVAGKGEWCTAPTPFQPITITYKVTLPLFHLCPMSTLCFNHRTLFHEGRDHRTIL